MAKTILYLHGDHFKPAAEPLLALFVEALRRGLERDLPEKVDSFNAVRKDIVYYGDLSNTLLLNTGKDYDEQLDIADRKNALELLTAVRKQKKFNRHAYQQLPGKSAVPEMIADLGAPILGKMGLAKPLASRVMPGLASYWEADSDYRRQVLERAKAKLTDAMQRREELMVIAHGLGSVIAYDALWELSQGAGGALDPLVHKVAHFLTLASPLGDSAVAGRIAGSKAHGAERYPANIVVWSNVSAEDDFVCHDKTIADDFKGMLTYRRISSIRDYRIYNLCVRYGKSNPHSSLGYLIHPRVSNLLGNWLQG